MRCEVIDAIAPEHRSLFDRLHRLILDVHPDAEITLSYKMPTYRVGERGLHVAVWKHGLSLYGWNPGRDAGFAARHPELANDKGTIRLGPDAAARISDAELCDFSRHIRPLSNIPPRLGACSADGLMWLSGRRPAISSSATPSASEWHRG